MDLQAAAKRVMLAHGFEPDFPPPVLTQVAELPQHPPDETPRQGLEDLRGLLWSSIDNDTSKDLDQIEVGDRLPDGRIRLRVGIADVEIFVARDSPIDRYAATETTTVYTGVRNFSMLPLELSAGMTSLLEGGDKLCVVIEMTVSPDGALAGERIYRAVVRNQAQLTYDAVGAWLEGTGPSPDKVAGREGLAEQLHLQREAAEWLRAARDRHGALNIETIEIRPVLQHGDAVDIVRQSRNHATELIEAFMIAANGVVARLLEANRVPSIRRVVRTPKRWDRIVALAAAQGGALPPSPDPKALNEFLQTRRAADPDQFPELSLAVIKLLGPGEYVLERPGDPEPGHFGLAVQDYTHSTAPNRRFADLVTQRLVKALLERRPPPYPAEELGRIAQQCTLKEDAARKVEREMTKRIAAVVMSRRIGQVFDAMVTGVTPSGTFVRLAQPRVEGLLVRGSAGVDVGDKLRVTLVRTDLERGYLDFARM